MSLNKLAGVASGGFDVDIFIQDVRDSMMNVGTSRDIKSVLRGKVDFLLSTKYTPERGKTEEYTDLAYRKLYGLGLLEKYLEDDGITDISVIGTRVMFKKDGVKEDAVESFNTEKEVRVLQDRILAPLNKSLTASNPSHDGELYDGSRVLLVIPPQSDKPTIIIRKHNRLNCPLDDLVDSISGLGDLLGYIKNVVNSRKNVMVIGETGAGKTTFINAMGYEIQKKHVIAVLEDTREIQLPLDYVYYFKTREGTGEVKNITYSTILRDCLRADPDRIILTEIRTPISAYEFVHVLNTGHAGSMTTIHANGCVDALFRLEMLILEHRGVEQKVVRGLISRALDVLIFLRVGEDSEGNSTGRIIGEVVELVGLDSKGDYVLKSVG